jgi:hypothetical protein
MCYNVRIQVFLNLVSIHLVADTLCILDSLYNCALLMACAVFVDRRRVCIVI